MNKIPNSQGINCIIMRPKVIAKCKLGQDWFMNDLEIRFIPDSCYPDYMEIESYIMTKIDGKELNIEEVVEILYDMLMDEYSPKNLQVVNNVHSAKTHFSVSVVKGDISE